MRICRASFGPPNSDKALSFHTSNEKVFRQIKRAMTKAGYELIEENPELSDISSAEEALEIARSLMPL